MRSEFVEGQRSEVTSTHQPRRRRWRLSQGKAPRLNLNMTGVESEALLKGTDSNLIFHTRLHYISPVKHTVSATFSVGTLVALGSDRRRFTGRYGRTRAGLGVSVGDFLDRPRHSILFSGICIILKLFDNCKGLHAYY